MMRRHRQSIRTESRFDRHRISAGVLLCLLAASLQGFSQTPDREERLRQRLTAYWQAMEAGDYHRASSYVLPESRNTFIAMAPKSRITTWEIQELDFNQEGTVCNTVTLVVKPFPMFGAEVDWPIRNQWVLADGDWYLKVSSDEEESPLLKLFKGQEDSVVETESLRNPPRPSREEALAARKTSTEAASRLAPDPDNPTSIHFGEKATFRYSYANNTDRPIRIVSIYSDCHCTSIQQQHPELAPGESASFEVTLDAFGLPPGRIRKHLSVRFDDLPNTITMALDIENLPNFIIDSPKVDFGAVEVGRKVRKTVRILNKSGKPVRILSISCNDPSLAVSIDNKNPQPDGEFLLNFEYTASRPGEFMDSVMMLTDLPAEPIINISVRGEASQ